MFQKFIFFIKQNPARKILFDFLMSILILSITTGFCFLITHYELSTTNCLLLYLIGIMAISILTDSMIFSFFSGFLSLILYNVLFVEPIGSLAIYDLKTILSILFTLVAILTINLLAYLTKKKEKEVAKANVRLFQAKTKAENDKYKMILLRSVSHDMRTPLTTIQMASSLGLENIKDEAKVKEMLKMINKESLFLSNVIEKQLLLTKVETLNQDSLKKEIIPVDELINQARNAISSKMDHRQIQIDSQEGLDVVYGDFTLLSSVLQNILENGIKFTDPQTGLIKILLRKKANGITITIENNGPKIKEEDLPKVFDLYFSRSKTGDQGSNSEGTGMGLTICQSIVKLHGGTINAKNTSFGPCFEFWIPNLKGETK